MQWLDFDFFFRERERESTFSLDFGRSDCRFLTEQEVKLLYAARAMRGH